jgi:bacterioferritin-associated ferredoxin
MYVCLCKGVTDAQVRAAVAAGARNVADLSLACEAGAGCGGCHRLLARLLPGWPAMMSPEEDRTPAA